MATTISSASFNGTTVRTATSGSVAVNRRTVKVVSAATDLSRFRELAWRADDGHAVGDDHCTQNYRFNTSVLGRGAPDDAALLAHQRHPERLRALHRHRPAAVRRAVGRHGARPGLEPGVLSTEGAPGSETAPSGWTSRIPLSDPAPMPMRTSRAVETLATISRRRTR